ncbi:hypothetical protein GR204_12290 [Rhizobium leguminosarum]|uniref:Uncharacterized protein n=1 Tax=Rhizobium leguminosarum TaxID=384 RepID=A0A6P0B4F9_RHILE|nr:hypothetical protein [Rhizobium leguminosarum]NEI34773.1 hypothetical protein [Rhizobium leguminosarum]NEI41136.1 hypothetical protein [Rhizobium leguminosarum]
MAVVLRRLSGQSHESFIKVADLPQQFDQFIRIVLDEPARSAAALPEMLRLLDCLVRAAHDFDDFGAVFSGCNDGRFVHLHRHVRFSFQQKQFPIPLGRSGSSP